MHTRPSHPHGPRRSSGRPLDVAASVVLTLGLLGSAAPAALAAEATPSTGSTPAPSALSQGAPAPSPSSSPTAEHPALQKNVTAEFVPDGSGMNANYTIHLKNTGDVPLTVVLKEAFLPADPPITLAAGESKDISRSTPLTADELKGGYWAYNFSGDAATPQGRRIEAGFAGKIIVDRTPRPTAAPSQPTTPAPSTGAPTPAPSTSAPIPAPLPVPTVATQEVTVTVTGRFWTAPGELVKEGTRVLFSQDVKNTGAVDVTNVLGRDKLAVGESFRLGTTEVVVTAQNLKDGFVPSDSESSNEILPGGTRLIVSAPKLTIPAEAPVPTEAPTVTPAPGGPVSPAVVGPVSPTAAGPDAQPSATPSAGAAARAAVEVATSSGTAASTTAGTAASTTAGTARSTTGRLASTGSDAAAVLPAAGVLALLGAVGVFLGRRRRSRTVTD